MILQHTGRGLEHLLYAEDGSNEGIHFLTGVVKSEGRTASAFDAEAMHERFGTVMTRADGDAEAVEQSAPVEMMDGPHLETYYSIVKGGIFGTENLHAWDFHHALHGIGGEVTFVSLDGIEAYGTDVVDGTSESCGGNVVGRASLELVGEVVEGGALERDGLYHLAAAHVGRDAVEPLFLAVEYADACGAVYLMSTESEEVAVEVLYIHLEVGRTLCSVNEDRDIVGVGYADDVLDGVDGAQDVADVGEREDTGAWCDEGLYGVQA